MSDPYRMTARQRVYLFVLVAVYFFLEFVPDVPNATPLQHLATVAIVVPIGLVLAHRATSMEPTDRLALVGAVGFLVAGVAYAALVLAAVVDLPSVTALTIVGPLGMLVGLLVYLYQTWR